MNPPRPSPGPHGVAPPTSLVRRLREQGRLLLAGVLCLAGTNALGMTIPWLLKLAVDQLRSPGSPVTLGLSRIAALIAGAALGQGALRTASRILIFNAGRNVEFTLRRDLFAHLTTLDPGFYRRHSTGDVMSRMTNDLSAVRMLFGPGVLNVVNTAMVYATGVWLLLRLSPRLTLIAIAPYPLLVFVARLWSRRIYLASRALQDQMGTLSTALQEDLAGITVVKSYALEDRRAAGFAGQSRAYLERALSLARTRGSLTPLFAVIAAVGTLIILWAGGREVIAGHMTLGALVAFNAYLAYLSFPTIALGWILAVWQRGIAAWVRVRDLLTTPSAIVDDGTVRTPAAGGPDRLPSVEIRELSLERDGRRILDRVSVEVPAGSSLAIVGPTGSGKTTLVDALPRLWDVPPGTVFVGGVDVHQLSLAMLRSSIGYAPQEAFLFSATVAENVAFGIRADHALSAAEHATRVGSAIAAAGLTPDIATLPDGVDTVVGERGIMLSGGQRQRVALARAIASQPGILILDDSLSSVDAQTERDILTRLRPILRGRTSIIISHRVAAVREADQILVLNGGRAAERGTHEALLAAGGLYASLYREQLAAEAAGVEAVSTEPLAAEARS